MIFISTFLALKVSGSDRWNGMNRYTPLTLEYIDLDILDLASRLGYVYLI